MRTYASVRVGTADAIPCGLPDRLQSRLRRADHLQVRAPGLTAALLLALCAVPAGPATAARADADPTLEAATARAAALSQELERSSARDGSYRVLLERLEEEQLLAQARLDARVRAVWTTRRPNPLGGLPGRLEAAGLRRIAHRGTAAAVRLDRELVDAVALRGDQAQALREQATRARTRLGAKVTAALLAQESARQLLARADAALAAATAAAAAAAEAAVAAAAAAADSTAAAAAEADRQRLATEATRLSTARAALDQASAAVTTALTPAQTRRSRRAQEREAPVVALVEAAGAGYPAGYRPTGEVIAGLASWYGPGFVGSPTASGTPYDPERLTCAHKTLRLGTVVRVSANGRAVSCLVNDRGPYVGPRILDMSRAGSRALGYDGVQAVVVEVLAPG